MVLKRDGLAVQLRRDLIFPIADGETGGFGRIKARCGLWRIAEAERGEIEQDRLLAVRPGRGWRSWPLTSSRNRKSFNLGPQCAPAQTKAHTLAIKGQGEGIAHVAAHVDGDTLLPDLFFAIRRDQAEGGIGCS